MVKFDLAVDREKAISEGLWLIFDHYLAVREWMPDFVAADVQLDKTLVWVRFPSLGMEYYDESVLLALATAVGRPIKVDLTTLNDSRGKFARVCVEIPLNEPVVGRVWFREHWFKVEYEGLHWLCTGCGRYGHLARNCTHAGLGTTISASSHGGGDKVGPLSGEVAAPMQGSPNPNLVVNEDCKNHGDDALHGDWLVVKKPKQPPKNQNSHYARFKGEPRNMGKSPPNHNSFNVLTDDINDLEAANPDFGFCPSNCFIRSFYMRSLRWICSGVYASPIPNERLRLWDYLRSLRHRFKQAWTLMGDFNEILLPSDQRGGVFQHSRATKFGQLVMEILPRRHSDHNPLLLRCGGFTHLKGVRPFRFEAAWCTLPSVDYDRGDPLSPYLFVLCMEKLGALITHAVQEGTWVPFRLARGGPPISHLFFADDVLLFTKAKPSSVRTMIALLDRFSNASGLRFNPEKSKAYALCGVPPHRKQKLFDLTNIRFTGLLGHYLGFHMVHGRVLAGQFDFILNKVQQRLASWKGKLLNRPSRVTLANVVVAAFPTYSMQMQWVPQKFCDALDRLTRQFIWSGEGVHKLHLVNWNIITQKRRHGGLGVRVARLQNTALLGKLIWDFFNHGEKLWVQFVAAKYPGLHMKLRATGSFFWQSLSKAFEVLKEGFKLKLRSGNVSFWFDSWLDSSPLCLQVPYGSFA
uniref:Ribonuclease H protein At1g65750 family n=1 Tax=Cajanus cajan TaxID=3821 RepID=A0A151TR63_CAJCA|nr:Putative ribonuclease H protein At1g65750 family [Cajanus cajan]